MRKHVKMVSTQTFSYLKTGSDWLFFLEPIVVVDKQYLQNNSHDLIVVVDEQYLQNNSRSLNLMNSSKQMAAKQTNNVNTCVQAGVLQKTNKKSSYFQRWNILVGLIIKKTNIPNILYLIQYSSFSKRFLYLIRHMVLISSCGFFYWKRCTQLSQYSCFSKRFLYLIRHIILTRFL